MKLYRHGGRRANAKYPHETETSDSQLSDDRASAVGCVAVGRPKRCKGETTVVGLVRSRQRAARLFAAFLAGARFAVARFLFGPGLPVPLFVLSADHHRDDRFAAFFAGARFAVERFLVAFFAGARLADFLAGDRRTAFLADARFTAFLAGARFLAAFRAGARLFAATATVDLPLDCGGVRPKSYERPPPRKGMARG